MKDPGKNSEPLDAILRRAMREWPDAPTPECADQESLAAYWDKSLGAADRERLEAHFADCMRCQMQLAAIARAEEPAIDASAVSKVPWFRRWRLAIPALAAVAAIAVFVAMRRLVNEESQSDQLVAMAKHEAPAVELAQPAAAPAAQVAAPASPPAAPASNEIAMNEPSTRPEAMAKREAPRTHHAEQAPAPAPAVAASASNELATNEAKPEAAPRADAISAAGPRAFERQAVAPSARAMTMTAQAGAAPGNAGAHPLAGAAIGAAVGAPIGAVSQNYAAASGATMLVTVSPLDRSVMWIVGKNGTVRRRDATGEIQIQHSGVSTDLLAGAAPSATVCWIVGRSGTIIRTTDGEHWTLITSPTADNLVAMAASSANEATITTASGQSFATSDGGGSWHPQ